jgi:sulfoxide reductase catalytic subunit YedY
MGLRRLRSLGNPAAPAPEDVPQRAESGVSPDLVRSYRWQLTPGEDVIDTATWAGSIPQVNGVAPRVRIGRRWFNLLWLLPIGFVLLIVAVAVAKGLRNEPSVQHFIARYPGTVDPSHPEASSGFPAWLRIQHFFNLFLLIFIVRAGVQILSDHPRLYWTRHSTPGRDWFRIQNPVPADPLWTAKQDSISLPAQIGLPGLRHSIGLARWWHLGIDALWLLNGAVFYVLLFASGHWRHLVPTSWAVFPNALSVLIQYLSLNWPLDNGWVAYNSLQLIAYFITLFVAAPLALITGLGMSPALSTRFKRISRTFSIQTARSLHFLVLVWFLVFIVVHTAMVFSTGLLVNLNHIYPGRNDHAWLGLWYFLASMAIVVVGWAIATPFTLRHPRIVQRVGQAIVGPLQHLFEHVDPKPGQYSEADISPYFWHNGQYPDSDEYKTLFDGNFADYQLRINGLVGNPVELDLVALRALPHHEQITQHFCIQGWSGIAKWGGVSMRTIVDLVEPLPEARWVVFYSLGEGADKGVYYDAHPIEHMSHHLTMLAYDMNDQPLSFGHGAPLRLRNEIELGFKQVKWIKGIEFVAHYSELGSGYGGYNQDHEFFGYRQSI